MGVTYMMYFDKVKGLGSITDYPALIAKKSIFQNGPAYQTLRNRS